MAVMTSFHGEKCW